MPELKPEKKNWVPVAGWTDDEWLASMAHFPPETPIEECEEWIFDRRREAAHEAAHEHRRNGGK